MTRVELRESLVDEVDRNPHDLISADIRMVFNAAYNAGLRRAANKVLELAQANIPVQPSFTYSGISAAILEEIAE